MDEHYQNPQQLSLDFDTVARNYVAENFNEGYQEVAYKEILVDRACSERIQEVFAKYGFKLELPEADADNIESIVWGNFAFMQDSIRLQHKAGAYAGTEEEYQHEEHIYGHAHRLVPRIFYNTRGDTPPAEMSPEERKENQVRPLEIILLDEVLSDDEKQRLMGAAQEVMGKAAFERATHMISDTSLMQRAVDNATFVEQLKHSLEHARIKNSIYRHLVDAFGDKYAWYSKDWDVMVPLPRGNELRDSLSIVYRTREALRKAAASGLTATDAQLQELAEATKASIEIADAMDITLTEGGISTLMTSVDNALKEDNRQ